MKKFNNLITLFLISAPVLATEVASPPKIVTITPSQLNANRAAYDGKLVHVVGFASIGFEHREFFDSQAASLTGDPFKVCVTIVNASKILSNMKKYNNKTLVLTGIFTQDISKKPYVQSGACNLTAIDLTDQPPPELY